MTISTVTNSVFYRGNGSTTHFAVPFKVLDEDHLRVRRRQFSTRAYDHSYVGTDFSYSGLGDEAGTLTLAGAPLANTYELVIERIVPYQQQLDIVNAGGFYPDTVEEQLDLIVMGVQQIAGQVDRALTVPVGETLTELPKSSDRAGKYLAFDSDGKAVVAAGTGADGALRTDLAAASGTSLISWRPAPGLPATNLQTALRLGLPLMPDFDAFGAKGDGVTDDTDAFLAMAEVINAAGSGRVLLRRGATYVVGRQATVATFDGDGPYHHAPVFPMFFHDLSYFELDMNGATIKTKDGLYFGAFSPGTTTPYHTPLPEPELFQNYAYRADPGPMLFLKDIDKAKIFGHGEFDGNFVNQVVGGRYGDVGWQIQHIGVWTLRVLDLTFVDTTMHDFGLDGYQISQTGLLSSDAARPTILDNIKSYHNVRQDFSLVGGNLITMRNCNLRDAGGVFNTGYGAIVGSAPKSCFDIEAEAAGINNLNVYDSQFVAGAETANAIVADTGGSFGLTFTNCLIEGVVFANKPGMIFKGCTIRGRLGKSFPGTRYIDCVFSDAPLFAPLPNAGELFHDGTGSPGAIFERCDFTFTRMFINVRQTQMIGCKWHWQVGTNVFADHHEFAYVDSGTWIEDCTFIDEIGQRLTYSAADGVFPVGAAVISTVGTGVGVVLASSPMGTTGTMIVRIVSGTFNAADTIHTAANAQNATIGISANAGVPTDGYVFQNPDTAYIRACRTTGKLFWASTVGGAGGYSGRFGVQVDTGLAGAAVAAGATYVHNIVMAGMTPGDRLTANYSATLGGLQLSAVIPSTNAGQGLFYNPTAGSINIPAGNVTYELSKLRP